MNIFLFLIFKTLFWFQQQDQNFGEPFLLIIHEGETLAEVKIRIQKKLQVPDEEFSKVFPSLSLSLIHMLLFIGIVVSFD